MEAAVKEASLSSFESAEDFMLSLLCTFGDWYNRSGQAERVQRQVNAANFTFTAVEMFVQEWHVFLPPHYTRALQVCPILGFMAVFVTTPTILARVLSSTRLRQQTRYLLLANVLLSDLLFVALYMLSTCLNTASVLMSAWTCAAILFLMGALYTAGIFSSTAIVLDTSLAVLSPLRYATLWPLSTTYRAIAGIWAASVLVPAASVGVFLWYQAAGPCSQHICSLPVVLVLTVSQSQPLQICMLLTAASMLLALLLVTCGYVGLYYRTSRAGVWRAERPSRARGTFLIHYLHLFLSACPMLLLAAELLIFCYSSAVNPTTGLWVSLVLCNVLLVLPKGLAPYLYGLRYRELRAALRGFCGLRRPRVVTPVM